MPSLLGGSLEIILTVPLTSKKNKYSLNKHDLGLGSFLCRMNSVSESASKFKMEWILISGFYYYFSIKMAQKVEEAMRTMPTMPKLDSESWANSKYHKVFLISKKLDLILLNFYDFQVIFSSYKYNHINVYNLYEDNYYNF